MPVLCLIPVREQLKMDARATSSFLGLNERIFLCTADQADKLVSARYETKLIYIATLSEITPWDLNSEVRAWFSCQWEFTVMAQAFQSLFLCAWRLSVIACYHILLIRPSILWKLQLNTLPPFTFQPLLRTTWTNNVFSKIVLWRQ